MWPTWGPPGPCRPHVGPMNLAIGDISLPCGQPNISNRKVGLVLADFGDISIVSLVINGSNKFVIMKDQATVVTPYDPGNCCKWYHGTYLLTEINTLSSRHNGRHFPDDIFKCISWMKTHKYPTIRFHWCLSPRVQLTIFQRWAWHRQGDKQ